MNDIKIPTVLTQQDIDKIQTSTKDNISLGLIKDVNYTIKSYK